MSTMPRHAYEESTKGDVASGIELFAGLMLVMVAILQILNGISALADDNVFIGTWNYVFAFDLTTWGWVTLTVGILAGVTAAGVLLRTTWGRMAGVFVAFVGALASFGFMPYYPWWAVVLLVFNGLVIWALLTQLYYLGE
jgi:hypothetical protein